MRMLMNSLDPGVAELPEQLIASGHPSAEAWDRVVECLLASPRYGERWGRHWLDVARYADTAGDNADYPIPEARLYREGLEAYGAVLKKVLRKR